MSRRNAITLTTLGLAVPAFALFPMLFTPHELAKPTPAELPLFVTLAALESLLFGLGVAFLVFARPYVKQTPEHLRNRAWAVYVTIGWLLLSWYPHDGLHIHAGLNLGALLAIEYAFHVPLYLAPLVLIWALTGFARAWKHPLPSSDALAGVKRSAS